MKLLLDTHILILAAAGTLPQTAIQHIVNKDNTLLFSPASIWEVVIKKGLGREDFKIDPFALYQGLLDRGYIELDITSRHVLAISNLSSIHKDPFDRILLAQAQSEEITFITADSTIAQYSDAIIHIRTSI